MGNRRISADVKLAAVRLYERGLLDLPDILDCVGFSRATFFQVHMGNVVKESSMYRGRRHKLNFEDLTYLVSLVNHRPDWFLDKLLGLLEHNRFISLHYTTIH